MPAPLPEPTVPVKWRVWEADLELLRAVYGDGEVNARVRALIHRHCDAIRAQLDGSANTARSA